MSNKRYAKIKTFIYENYKFLLFLILCTCFFSVPLPYVIDMPGGLLPVEDRVSVEDGFKTSGSFNLSYVNEVRANPSTYLLSFLRTDWKMVKTSEIKYDHESLIDAEKRSQLLLRQANQNAITVAYHTAKKTLKLSNPKFHVAYLDSKVEANVKIGDIITKINGKEMKEYDDILNTITSSTLNDTLTLTLTRDKKQIETELQVLKIDGKKRLGLLVIPLYEIKTNPKVTFTYHKKESGSSGGLMMTLEIYNRLVKEDITHGKTIVGTGTIDENGNVGEIAGIEFKLRGAVKKHADIFFAPAGDNYKEAIQLKKENNFDIQIVSIKNFQEALNYLEKLD